MDFDGFGFPIASQDSTSAVGRQVEAEYEAISDADFRLRRGVLARKALNEFLTRQEKGSTTTNPTVFFSGGGAGSGKTAIAEKFILTTRSNPMSVWTIDPDLFKERIPEYRALVDAGHPGAAGIVHEESKAISLFAYTLAIDQRINILYDSTLSGSAPNIPLFELARARGFRLELVAATVRPDTALRRVLARGQATGRYVAPRIVLWTHKQFSVSCAECAPYFDAWRLYDNNGPIDRVRRIVSGVRGLPDIIDNPAALAEFSSYSRINENAKSYEEIGL